MDKEYIVMKLRWLGPIGLAAALALTACGGGDTAEGNSEDSQGESDTTLEVVGTQDLKWNPEQLQAPADQAFTVNFENAAEGLQHNFVIVQPGSEDAIAQEALEDGGEVEADGERILAATNLVEGGDDDELEVEALQAGNYSYICTVAGHAASMRGTLTVQ